MEELTLTGNEKLILKKDYLPYTYWRLVEILKVYCNAELQLVCGYKEGRYNPYYKQRYNIVDLDTHEVLQESIHLEDLRYHFARLDIPLRETTPKQAYKPPKGQELSLERNRGAEAFLRAVKGIQTDHM